MSLRSGVVDADALRLTATGFDLDVRLCWYRSLPLSCVTELAVAVDGAPVAPNDLRVAVNDGEHRLEDLAARHDDWWFVLDAATLRIATATPPRVGRRATVGVRLGLRIPYIEVGPGRYLELATDIREEVVVR
jgi:hypothetical protein